MTVGLVAEALLRKIIADPAGFNSRERTLLSQERSQLDRWKRAVDLAFRRHYAVPIHLDVDTTSAGANAASQHKSVIDLLEHDLAEIIEDRNKIAHGQWSWLLNSKETSFKGAAALPLNYREIQARSKLVREIEALIRDLVISEPTFSRDYTRRYAKIQELKRTLDGADYDDLVKDIKRRRQRSP
jgi:hypothetical protein